MTDVGTMLGARLTGAGIAQVMAQDIVLNLFHEGEVFGDGRPRTADATAMSDCELVVIERRDFVPFLSSHPDVMLKFIEMLCSRLRRTSEQVHPSAIISAMMHHLRAGENEVIAGDVDSPFVFSV